MNDFESNEQKRIAAEHRASLGPESGIIVPDFSKPEEHIKKDQTFDVPSSGTERSINEDVAAEQTLPSQESLVPKTGNKIKDIIEAAGSTPANLQQYDAGDVVEALNEVIAKGE